MRDDKIMLRYLFISVLAISLAFAAEVAGKWRLQSQTAAGAKTMAELEIREDWGQWNAVLIIEDDKVPLRGVAVDGDKITFQLPTGDATYTVTGVVKGDQMEGIFSAQKAPSRVSVYKNS